MHGEILTGLVEKRLQSFNFVEFEQRLSALEQRPPRGRNVRGAHF